MTGRPICAAPGAGPNGHCPNLAVRRGTCRRHYVAEKTQLALSTDVLLAWRLEADRMGLSVDVAVDSALRVEMERRNRERTRSVEHPPCQRWTPRT